MFPVWKLYYAYVKLHYTNRLICELIFLKYHAMDISQKPAKVDSRIEMWRDSGHIYMEMPKNIHQNINW